MQRKKLAQTNWSCIIKRHNWPVWFDFSQSRAWLDGQTWYNQLAIRLRVKTQRSVCILALNPQTKVMRTLFQLYWTCTNFLCFLILSQTGLHWLLCFSCSSPANFAMSLERKIFDHTSGEQDIFDKIHLFVEIFQCLHELPISMDLIAWSFLADNSRSYSEDGRSNVKPGRFIGFSSCRSLEARESCMLLGLALKSMLSTDGLRWRILKV